MIGLIPVALGAVAIAGVAASAEDSVFEKPVRLKAGGAFVDTDVGHAAPYLYDFDDDGDLDLLVGQFGEGKLRIFENEGSSSEPAYIAHEWFIAGGAPGTVPAS